MKQVPETPDRVIVAVDPGGTTGVAWFYTATRQYGAAEVIDPGVLYDLIEMLMGQGCTVELVAENWIILPGSPNEPEALKIIGALEYLARKHGLPMTLQLPSAKAFASDDKLRVVGFYQPSLGHANDAARHLIVYLVQERDAETLDKILEVL